jgi:hypothetical protein
MVEAKHGTAIRAILEEGLIGPYDLGILTQTLEDARSCSSCSTPSAGMKV